MFIFSFLYHTSITCTPWFLYDLIVMELCQSRTLCVDDLRKGNFTVEIARKLASYHLMDMPLRKQPVFLLETCENWLASIPETFDNADHNTKLQQLLDYVDGLKNELGYVKQLIGDISSPSVFSHNDLNEGNVLSIEHTGQNTGDKPIVFIDFEYSSYNYRGYDIANFFCEWTFDYSSKELPCFKYSPEDYPTKEQQLKFIRAYLDCFNEYQSATVEKKEKIEFDLLTEVERLTIPCHFFWVLWSIVQQTKSQHKFGFLDYALTRMKIYVDLKKKFTDPSESKL
ncbi:choline/ethanolamine kinase-like [Ptychodera flava]|uniref:choline/ethanolamine kinase-like n=1 Tax=Ptychodera flava TaxID=63121 RepID=UPI00396A7A79